MHKHRIEKLLVVDKDQNLKGLITVKDITKKIKYPLAAKDRHGRLRVAAAIGATGDFVERTAELVRAKVDVVGLYETVAEQPDPDAVEAAKAADYLTFTSSSTVRNFVEAVGDGLPSGARVVSIGPVTSEAARGAGLTVAVEAERHDPEGLVEALLADAG